MDDQLQRKIFSFLASRPERRAPEVVGSCAVASWIGSVRAENQDTALLARVRYSEDTDRDFDLAVVCDGLGGMSRGREASLLAASVFVARILRTTRLAPVERLVKAVMSANQSIYQLLKGNGGATLSSVMLQRRVVVCANVGDSRIYATTGGGELRQLSKDDTIDAVLNRHDEDELRSNRLLQFVGVGEDLEPHVFPLEARSFERFILTSDGAHGAPTSVLSRTIRFGRGSADIARRLITLADLLGGEDNASVVVMPGVPEKAQPVDGVNVSLISHAGELQIWIPPSALEVGEAVAIPPADQERIIPANERVVGVKRAAKGSNRRGPRKQKPKSARLQELPLDEPPQPLQIEFPEEKKD